MAATTSIRLQLLLVREDVEVGEGVGLGIQIQVLPAHVGSRLAAVGEGRRRDLGIEAKLVGGGEGRSRGAGCGVGRKRCLSEEIPVVVVLAVHGGCAVWRSGRGGASVGRNGGGVVLASEAAAGRSVSEMENRVRASEPDAACGGVGGGVVRGMGWKFGPLVPISTSQETSGLGTTSPSFSPLVWQFRD